MCIILNDERRLWGRNLIATVFWQFWLAQRSLSNFRLAIEILATIEIVLAM